MGVSIDIHIYDKKALYEELKSNLPEELPSGRTLDEFTEKILPKFGLFDKDKFYTLWNEYYEDYNSGWELFRAYELYFNVEGVWFDSYELYTSGANAREVLEDLGIEPLGVDDDL